MATKIAEKTIDFVIGDHDSPKPALRLFSPNEKLKSNEKALECLASLMGESEPEVCALPPSYALDGDSRMYRFDWIFGVGCLAEGRYWWDWQAALRERSGVAAQVIISTGDSGHGFSEISAALLALPPSRDTRSWFETHGQQLGQTLASLGQTAAQAPVPAPAAGVSRGLGAVLTASAAVSNFVTSGESSDKSWFIYRFLDPEQHCCAIEWRINKKVLLQFGPLLRGSLLLAFHGGASPKTSERGRITMLFRPQLGFYSGDELCFVRPTDLLDAKQQVRLVLTPRQS